MASIKDIEIQFKTKGESEFVASAKRMKQAADDIGKGTSGATRQARQDVDQLAGGFSNLQKGIITAAAAISTFRGVTSAFSFVVKEIRDLAEQGARIQGLTVGFQNLQNSIGNFAGGSLQQLRSATQGLVSDLDLMQKANQAVLLGLPKEGFDRLAGSAIKLGRAMGIDALAAVDSLTIGIGRQSRLVLDNLGIIVLAEQAYKNYAQAMGIVGRELSDEEKKLAFQADAIRKVTENADKIGLSFEDAGSAAQQLSASFTNLFNDFLEGISRSEDLARAIRNIKEVIDSFRTGGGGGQSGGGVGSLFGRGFNAIFDVGRITGGSDSWGEAASRLQDYLRKLNDDRALENNPQTSAAAASLQQIKIIEGEITAQKQAQAKISNDLDSNIREQNAALTEHLGILKTSASVQKEIQGAIDRQLRGEISKEQFAQKVADIAKREQETRKQIVLDQAAARGKGISDPQTLASATASGRAEGAAVYDDVANMLKKATAEYKKYNVEGDKAARAAERIATRVSRAFSQEPGNEFLDQGGGIVTKYLFGDLSGAEAARQMTEVLSRVKGGTGDVINALSNYQAEGKKTFDEVNALLKDQADHVEDLIKKYEELSGKKLARPITQAESAGLENAVQDLEANAGVTKDLTDAIYNAANEGLRLAFSGKGLKSADYAQFASSITSDLGKVAAKSFGASDQEADLAGNIVGTLTSVIASSFNKDTPGTKARKSVDKWFADLFDAERIGVVVGGQVSRIQDFVFKGNSPFGGNISGFAQGNNGFAAFQSLDDKARQGFAGVGSSLEQLLGVTYDVAGQIAAVLANNIGGSLENLQLLVQETGYSFEQMGEALLQSFYGGTLSIQEFYNGLRGLQDVFTEGIPGQIGAVGEAFANLQASLADGKGSRLMLDSIRDLGAEAQELGINTLPNLASAMVNQFGIAADKVAAIMEAMKVAGIGSVKDLLDASISTIAAVAANIDSLTKGQAAVAVGITDPTQVEGRTPPTLFSPAKYAEGKKEKAGKNEILEQVNAIKGILSASESYQKVVSDLASGLISKKEALKASNIEYKAAARLVSEQTKLEKELEIETKKGKKASQERMQNLLLGLSQVNKKISEFGKGIKLGDGELIGQLDELAKKMSNFFDIGAAAASAGVGLDNLTNSVTELFKRGSIGADEALKKYLQYKEALEGGVLGKTGAVGEAIDKLISTGADAGTLSIQAFKGILTEGKEANLGTLGDFYEKFKEKLGVPAAEALRDSLNAEKIFNFEDFSKVSDDAIVRLLGRMKELKFPFEETSNETKKLLDQITQIGKLGPQYVDVILKVSSQYDSSATRRLAQQGNINVNRGEGVAQR